MSEENPVAGTTPAQPPAELHQALGARLRAVRVTARLSQPALAAAAGVSYQQLQKYESGRDRVAAVTLHAMARALGVSLDALFSDETPTPSTTLAEAREAQRIGSRVLALKDPDLVRRVMALVDVLAGEDGTGSEGA